MTMRPWLLVPILAFLPPAALRAQEQFNFDGLTREIAPLIQKSSASSSTPLSVLVLNFDETHAASTELGPELANDFAASLRNYAQGFVVLRPADLRQTIANHNLPEATISWPQMMKCLAPELKVSTIIEGGMENGADGVVLKIHTALSKNRDSSFEKTIIIPVTAQMKQLMAKPLPEPPPFFTEEKRVWISKDHPPVSDAEVINFPNGSAGYTYPNCVTCNHPDYSSEAAELKIQGTIILRVQILPDGFPSKISLVRGIPCGLTEKAFEAVEHWKFSPATGPDGTPVAVEVPIEVQFRLY
jgi:TonB family protein